MEDLTQGDLARIEYLLKKDLARRLGAIQEDRSAGPAGSANVGNAEKYVKTARTLRRLLVSRGRQSYKPLRDLLGAGRWVNDDVKDVAGIGDTDTVAEVTEKIHTVRNPNFEPRTLTDHPSVPGQPS